MLSPIFEFGQDNKRTSNLITSSSQDFKPCGDNEYFNPLKRKLPVELPPPKMNTCIIITNKKSTKTINQLMHKPSKYYRKETNSNFASLVWDKYNSQCLDENGSLPSVPQFQADDLKATFHKSFKLGCNHYARSCKLRHPVTGRLHTCRLCCEDEIEESNEDGEISSPLDRFSVTELLCMKCNSLQPTRSACINPVCMSKGAPFAKYVCTVSNLFDDEKRDIYHCPHCNVCRVGKGLGIDYEHCMECDVCIAIKDFKNHT
jgi:hypothetical protein